EGSDAALVELHSLVGAVRLIERERVGRRDLLACPPSLPDGRMLGLPRVEIALRFLDVCRLRALDDGLPPPRYVVVAPQLGIRRAVAPSSDHESARQLPFLRHRSSSWLWHRPACRGPRITSATASSRWWCV